jgi:hypothetical protein
MNNSNELPTVPVHQGGQFFWRDHVGYADASDIGGRYYGRVYRDAADVGFKVKSGRTGRVLTFFFAGNTRDDEGDLLYTEFKTTDGKFIIRINND